MTTWLPKLWLIFFLWASIQKLQTLPHTQSQWFMYVYFKLLWAALTFHSNARQLAYQIDLLVFFRIYFFLNDPKNCWRSLYLAGYCGENTRKRLEKYKWLGKSLKAVLQHQPLSSSWSKLWICATIMPMDWIESVVKNPYVPYIRCVKLGWWSLWCLFKFSGVASHHDNHFMFQRLHTSNVIEQKQRKSSLCQPKLRERFKGPMARLCRRPQ
jgi:hypothetical protein